MKRLASLVLVFLLLISQFSFLASPVHAAVNFTNPGFESDLSGWSPTYSLLDQYNTALSAGSINGTSAEPTGGTRTVTDTNSKLSIVGGQLSFATGGVAYGNPGLWYPSITRKVGLIIIGTITPSTDQIEFGFHHSQSSSSLSNIIFVSGTNLSVLDNNLGPIVATISTSTAYNLAVVLRTTGAYYFIKGGAFTNWTYLGSNTITSSSTLYPTVLGRNLSVFTADNIRIPTSTFIPTPTAYDTFTTASSTSTETTGPDSQTVSSLPWTGSTWSVSGGSVSNAPTTGSELATNGNMETGNPPSSWVPQGDNTLAASTERTGGSGVQSLQITLGLTNLQTWSAGQTITSSNGVWYTLAGYTKIGTANTTDLVFDSSVGPAVSAVDWTSYAFTHRRVSNGSLFLGVNGTAGKTGFWDDVSIKALTTSALFRTVDSGSADGLIETAVTGPTSTSKIQGGLVLNLDSTSNPQNFIIVYLDGAGNVNVDEDVAGTYTNKASTAVTYSAGAVLRAIKYGNSLDIYYNNAKVGSTLTMTANTNTRMGLFSTSSTNTFDNFAVWPRSGYNLPDLVVSRDTSITYGGSSGSAKVVGGANAGTFTQSVNTGDASRYTLSSYAYTDGSAVSSSDLSLYAGGVAVPTTYTSAGSGWFQLTGTVTGNTVAADYGVQVQPGKTVYVDNMNLGLIPLTTGGGGTACTDTAPASAPTITSITNPTSTSLTLNFTKASDPVSYYALEYGTKTNDYPYGSTNIGGSSTTQYTVNLLNPATTYYFRIRAGNGCTPGPWSNEFSALTSGGYQPIPLNLVGPTTAPAPVIPVVPVPAPTPAVLPSPQPSAPPVSFRFPTITWPAIVLPTIAFPQISWPQISLPRIAFSFPKITLPQITLAIPQFSLPHLVLPQISLPVITFTWPRITLPRVAINLNPLTGFIRSTFSGIGKVAGGFLAFVKESVAYAGFIASERSTKQALFWNKIGEWISFTTTSFKEIVLDEAPTVITDVKVVKVTPTSATISWTTNHLSTSKINYGETLSYGLDVHSELKVHEHVLGITNLKPDTKYLFEVMSQNKNYVFDAWHEFTTSKE